MTGFSLAHADWRGALRRLLLLLAVAWVAFWCWRSWHHAPHVPLDSGLDAVTRGAYDAVMRGYVLKSIVIGVAGLAVLLGLASLLGRRRADAISAPSASIEAAQTWTGPARILLTRHAEKTGELDDIHLSKSGVERAARLAEYIPATFGKPDFIFAAARSKRSIRSIETMQPLAAALGKVVRFDIEDKEFPALVAALKADPAYRGSLVVVCWHHGKLPEIAADLGAPAGSYPAKWPDKTFDLIIELDYRGGRPPSVRKIVEPF